MFFCNTCGRHFYTKKERECHSSWMHPPVTNHGGEEVPSLINLASRSVTSTTRVLLTARIQRIKNLRLALNSIKSTEYVLFLIGNLIDDFDTYRGKLKNRHDDYQRMETLHLRFRKELNLIYNLSLIHI